MSVVVIVIVVVTMVVIVAVIELVLVSMEVAVIVAIMLLLKGQSVSVQPLDICRSYAVEIGVDVVDKTVVAVADKVGIMVTVLVLK
jgi:hypothetical protein